MALLATCDIACVSDSVGGLPVESLAWEETPAGNCRQQRWAGTYSTRNSTLSCDKLGTQYTLGWLECRPQHKAADRQHLIDLSTEWTLAVVLGRIIPCVELH